MAFLDHAPEVGRRYQAEECARRDQIGFHCAGSATEGVA
jgi:hypothetical protein